MKLFFLRHGKAEDRRDGHSDEERRLTPEGVSEMHAVGRGLSALEVLPTLVLSSPLPRALETARIVSENLGLPAENLIVTDRLASGRFGLGDLQDLVKGKGPNVQVMLVGHEPDFSTVVRRLTGASIELKRGGLVYVEAYTLSPDGGVLRWLLTPRHMMR